MKRDTRRHRATTRGQRAHRAIGLLAAVTAASSCHELDTTRQARTATLGDDVYGLFCDRLGASSFTEDQTGASYASICHYDADGKYGDRVDISALPPPEGPAAEKARRLSVAKLERLAQRRSDVVRAVNAAVPDVMIEDVTAKTPNAEVRLHDALSAFAQAITPLYESNPVEPGGEPLLPAQTRALGRLFEAMGGSDDVLDTLSGTWGRRGYRPSQVGLGVVRPALAYPDLRALTTSTLALLAPGGAASGELQQALGVLKQEMLTLAPTIAPLPDYVVAPATAQPNRPREAVELAAALFLGQDQAFSTGTGSLFIAQRDRRGLAIPRGNTPGAAGTVPAPFVDLDKDGYADVDAFGRFVGADGAPLPLDPPFAIPGQTTAASDGFGRLPAAADTFTYIDTSKTLVGGFTRHLVPLLDPTVVGAPGDPEGWQREHETLMYALAGAHVLFGERLPKQTYDYGKDGPGGGPVTYTGFDADTSPIPELVHAAGQVIADPDSDALLLSLLDLVENHEGTVARLLGAALRLREIALEHDAMAMTGSEPFASLDYHVPIWDELAQVAWAATRKPGLVKALLGALGDPSVLQPIGNATDMGDALAKFVTYKDQLGYDKHGTHADGSPGGVNGPAVNLTADPSGGDTGDPRTPVDDTAPRTGANASCMQRSLALIDDANGGPACNRSGAKISAKLGPVSLTWPIVGSGYAPCELFQIDNLATFYLDSMLPPNHPRRAYLKIKAPDLDGLLNLLGGLGVDKDALLEQSSDIQGFTQHPEPAALSRFVCFGAGTNNPAYQGMPDEDLVNKGKQVDKFISGAIDPMSCAWCPPDANGIPTCADKAGLVRVRDPNTIFLWERFGFTKYLQPIVIALADAPPQDGSGEALFGDIVRILNRHWPGPDHGAECQSADKAKPVYCSGAGLNRYEPLLADAFRSDVFAALHELADVAQHLSKITVARGPKAGQVWTGADVMEKLAVILFSQDYAKQAGMVDRRGKAGTTWVDGTPQGQLTAFNLFADALHQIDTRFAEACKGATDGPRCMADAEMRRGQWKRARSQLTDEILAVDGAGASSKFRSPLAKPAMVAILKLAREQVNANCPAREQGTPCTWAKKDLGDRLAAVMRRPLFASLADLLDKLRGDEASRRALESFLRHLLQGSNNGGDLGSVLASLADAVQLLMDDGHLAPVLHAGAPVASPESDPAGPGAASLGISVLKALTDESVDRYHALDHVLRSVVAPMDGGASLSPLEILMDVVADVNRIDAGDAGPFAPADYGAVMRTMRDFMLDRTRGMEQLYTIIQKRRRP